MAYERKVGDFALFKNERRTKDTQPTHTGTILLEDGEHWLSAWVKEGRKGRFFSGRVGDLTEQQSGSGGGRTRTPETRATREPGDDDDFDDDIPF